MSRRGALLDAAVWGGLGASILVAAWRMDRLEHQGIDPLSAPGLTPGVIGALMLVMAVVLALRARQAAAPGAPAEGEVQPNGSLRRVFAAALLCVIFAGVTLGRGLPFVAEGAVFIFAFTSLFSWQAWQQQRRIGRSLLRTLLIAVLASAFIAWLFESVFLVRLP